jgi:uncharacterized protein (TIGR03435 family)
MAMVDARLTLSSGFMAVFLSAAVLAQTAEQVTFEVASVKPSLPAQLNRRVFYGPPRGGPGTRDPGRIVWENAALRNILMTAYDVQTYQLTAPDWLSTARYDVVTNVPSGATKRQVNRMWQSLLKERFRLALHHESKQFPVDELILAKGGPKLKESDLGLNPDPFTPAEGPPKFDKNGSPEMNGFGSIVRIFGDGRASMFAKGLTLADLAIRLGQQLGHPVIDKTGLAGRYDFTLEYSLDLTGLPLPRPPGAAGPAPGVAPLGDSTSDPRPDLAAALEKQLGLKLNRAKAQLDVIVVDHAEKAPTQN